MKEFSGERESVFAYRIMMLKKTLWRVSGGRKQGGCSKCRVVGFDHSWQLQLIEQQRKHCMGQGRRWLHVCGRSLPEFPSCSRPDTNGPWISSQITLQYLPVQKPVWLLSDTWVLLQFGLSCYLGQLSVFHLRDQQTSDDEVVFFFFSKNEKFASRSTCLTLKT